MRRCRNDHPLVRLSVSLRYHATAVISSPLLLWVCCAWSVLLFTSSALDLWGFAHRCSAFRAEANAARAQSRAILGLLQQEAAALLHRSSSDDGGVLSLSSSSLPPASPPPFAFLVDPSARREIDAALARLAAAEDGAAFVVEAAQQDVIALVAALSSAGTAAAAGDGSGTARPDSVAGGAGHVSAREGIVADAKDGGDEPLRRIGTVSTFAPFEFGLDDAIAAARAARPHAEETQLALATDEAAINFMADAFAALAYPLDGGASATSGGNNEAQNEAHHQEQQQQRVHHARAARAVLRLVVRRVETRCLVALWSLHLQWYADRVKARPDAMLYNYI